MQKLLEGVWKIMGKKSGAKVAIIGGTHGNEQTGIRVVEHLLAACQSGGLMVDRGELILAIGNPEAVRQGRRHTHGGEDLNRLFGDKNLIGHKPATSYESNRARELATVFNRLDVAIDIHATNKPSEPFVVCQPSLSSKDQRLIRWLGATKVVCDPQFVFAGRPVTLDEYVVRSGGSGLCYETGLASEVKRVGEVMMEVLNILCDLEVISSWPTGMLVAKDIFQLSRPFCLTEAGFSWEIGMGVFNFQPVMLNAVIGWHGERPERAEAEGVILFPKIRELWQVGMPVGYLAQKIELTSSPSANNRQ